MRSLLCGLFFSILSASSGWGAPHRDHAYGVKETVAPPRGWVKHSVPSPDHTITLRIGLPQPSFHVLETHLYEVSDPFHERYGAHLSKEEVEALVAPYQESLDFVDEWLASHGVTNDDLVRSPAKDWVTLRVPVSLAEEMLDTVRINTIPMDLYLMDSLQTYFVWKHIDSGDYLVRTTSYSLPRHLHEHVDLVQPTTSFGRFKESKSTLVWGDGTVTNELVNQLKNQPPIVDATSGAVVDASCNITITINCLQQLYNAVGYVPSARGNSIGITGYLEQFANIQDLQEFYADQRPDALNSSFNFISVNGLFCT